MVVSAVRPARWAVDQVLTRVRLKKFRVVSRKSAVGMLYAVMDRVRSDFERFTRRSSRACVTCRNHRTTWNILTSRRSK